MGVRMSSWRWAGLMLLSACERVELKSSSDASDEQPAEAPTAAIEPVLAEEVISPPGTRNPVASNGDKHLQSILHQARSGRAFERLTELCDDVGHRLSGSKGYLRAVDWASATFRADHLPTVRTEPVMVPAWVRGEESARMLRPRELELPMLGLGNSPGTPGVQATVVVVRTPEEVDERVRGHIVLFHTEMAQRVPAYKGYGDAVWARGKGPPEAAKHGAVGALVRSMTTRSLGTPHTGVTFFLEGEPQIPAAALATEQADLIARLVDRGIEVEVRLEMEAHWEADQATHNVVADIPGSESPEEVVLIGGHLDSWDVGQGAHDDGAGIAEVVEAMRILAQMPPPRRTIRAVLFANEENGLRGANSYFEAHGEETHVAAIECDLGGGWPLAWGATGTDTQLAWLGEHAAPLGLPVSSPGGGADISPLKQTGTLVVGLRPDDSHYFDVHHTWADTLDKVDPDSLKEAAGAVAGLAWLLANAPQAPGPSGEAH